MQKPVSIGIPKAKSTYLYSSPNPEREVFYVNVPNCLPGNKRLNIKISIEHWYSDNKSATKLQGEKNYPSAPMTTTVFATTGPGSNPPSPR
jgi:hypothetical protein